PRVLLEERPLELRRARVPGAGADAVLAGGRARPRVLETREGAELDLAVARAAVVDVALPVHAVHAVHARLGDGRERGGASVLLGPEGGRGREARLRGAARIVAARRDERVGGAVEDDDGDVPRRAPVEAG